MTTKRFEKILLCLAEPEAPKQHDLERAVELARAHDATLEILTVIEESTTLLQTVVPPPFQVEHAIEEERRKALDQLATRLADENVRVDIKLAHGQPHIRIIEEVLREGHDLVVATAHRRADSRRFFGSTVVRLMRYCPCPVCVIGPGANESFDRIAATVDLFPPSEEREGLNTKVVEIAESIAAVERARLDVLLAWSVYGESLLARRLTPEELQECVAETEARSRRALDEFLERIRADVPSERVFLERGEPADAILKFVDDHETDLVVMGTVARSGVPGFIMGNTAERVFSRMRCSVLAVKPEGFESPVHL